MPSRQYFLPRDTHFCCSPTWCVFLDLARDRYRCLVRQEWEVLMPNLQASPSSRVTSSTSIDEAGSSASEQTLAWLVARGFLTIIPDHRKLCTPTTFRAPTRDLGLAAWRARRKVSARDAWQFARTVCGTARSMKRRSLLAIIGELEKEQSSAGGTQSV